MTKKLLMVMAATLICGASVFTSCTTDTSDNPSEQAKKNRKEFIAHTRENLKEVAENLNFSTWKSVNYFNTYFNQYVLLNDEFDKTVSRTFGQEVQKTLKPLPAEAAEKYGKKYVATMNFADFDYIFKSNGTGFDVTQNAEDGMIVEITSTYMPELAARISIVGSGEEYDLFERRLSNDSVAVIVKIPARYDFSFSTLQNGEWVESMTVCTELTVVKGEYDDPNLPAEAANVMKDAWNLKGTIKTSIPGDATEAVFNIGQDPRIHKAGMTIDYTHNSKKIIGLKAEMTNSNGMTDLSSLLVGNSLLSSSIMDVMQAIMLGNSLDNFEITLLDDLTTSVKVTDCYEVMVLQSEMADARRNYADQQTIEGYVSELNKYISGTMTCKGLDQTIPMKLQTTKIGVDWWASPALNFADENGYVSLYDMLDKESVEYGLNIIDHAAGPMKQSVVTVRQLMQALQKMQNAFYKSMNSK